MRTLTVGIGHCVDQNRNALDFCGFRGIARCGTRNRAGGTEAIAQMNIISMRKGIQQELGRVGRDLFGRVWVKRNAKRDFIWIKAFKYLPLIEEISKIPKSIGWKNYVEGTFKDNKYYIC